MRFLALFASAAHAFVSSNAVNMRQPTARNVLGKWLNGAFAGGPESGAHERLSNARRPSEGRTEPAARARRRTTSVAVAEPAVAPPPPPAVAPRAPPDEDLFDMVELDDFAPDAELDADFLGPEPADGDVLFFDGDYVQNNIIPFPHIKQVLVG
eukprot:CAMPEP_0119271586 /NCGR_PEP_ID=MMETSP1329-20130426/8119_1 /TAXON_ID=114041 /ORGANISM="Genus nov. species nov., Strain RCC1024" /LENGTH=153 /DNA_ID=CAMNT_0007271635 /DNA_START=158 /DNA_END=616 /DNA_ORIENTATION=-